MLAPATGRAEDELVHQRVIGDQQVLLHRAGRDFEGLNDEGTDEQRQNDRDDDGFEVFARDDFLILISHGHPHALSPFDRLRAS